MSEVLLRIITINNNNIAMISTPGRKENLKESSHKKSKIGHD